MLQGVYLINRREDDAHQPIQLVFDVGLDEQCKSQSEDMIELLLLDFVPSSFAIQLPSSPIQHDTLAS